jgi:hypothetical protein
MGHSRPSETRQNLGSRFMFGASDNRGGRPFGQNVILLFYQLATQALDNALEAIATAEGTQDVGCVVARLECLNDTLVQVIFCTQLVDLFHQLFLSMLNVDFVDARCHLCSSCTART